MTTKGGGNDLLRAARSELAAFGLGNALLDGGEVLRLYFCRFVRRGHIEQRAGDLILRVGWHPCQSFEGSIQELRHRRLLPDRL